MHNHNNTYSSFWTAWTPALLFMVFVTILSSIPGSKINAFPIISWDKLLHIVLFFPFGWMLVRGAIHYGFKRTLLFSIVVVILFAIIDELHQYFTPNRCPDIFDIIADTIGGSLGALARSIIDRKST